MGGWTDILRRLLGWHSAGTGTAPTVRASLLDLSDDMEVFDALEGDDVITEGDFEVFD